MKSKRILILTLVILILASMAISCMACVNDNPNDGAKNEDAKSMAKELLTANSFTVEKDGVEIFRYEGVSCYWKVGGDSLYSEYYFMPDGEGKNWVYYRSYSEDTWEKSVFALDEYVSYLYAIKSGLGEDLSALYFLGMLFMDFDTLMKEENSTYTLKQKLSGLNLERFELSKVGEKLVISLSIVYSYMDNYKEDAKYVVSNINNTKVTLSESAQKATVGEVMLP